MFRLANPQSLPQGTFWYVNTIGDKKKTCGPSPSREDVARCIAAFRAGNGLPSSSFTDGLQALDEFTCARTGNAGCVESTEDEFLIANQSVPGVRPCKACGAPVS